jgi:hypothetical protein
MSCLDCKYIGSRGILNLCDRKSPIPVPDFDGLNPALYENIQEGDILHVCPQALKNFVSKVLPKITKSFILVTNNSDLTIPNDVQSEFITLIENPYLIHWFSQNCILDHPKITRIPIGLDYHSLTPTRKQAFSWSQPERHAWGIKVDPNVQETQLITLNSISKPYWDREVKAYANFHFLMTTRYGKVDRIDAFNTVSNKLVYYEPTKSIRDICWNKMIQYAFVLSPHGNGLDCHRTWEAICLGCIPIIKSSGLDPLFKDLPVWIVNSWTDVTKENMEIVINEFRQRTFRYERLTLSYWRDIIASAKSGRRTEGW